MRAGRWLCVLTVLFLSGVSFSEENLRIAIVVGREITAAEKAEAAASKISLHPIAPEKVGESRYTESDRQRLHEYVMQRIAFHNPNRSPYRLEWTEAGSRGPVIGDIVLQVDGVTHLIRNIIERPLSETKTPPTTSIDVETSFEGLLLLQETKAPVSTLLPALIRWVSVSPQNVLNCKVVRDEMQFATPVMQKLFASAGLKNVKSSDSNEIRPLIEATAIKLTREGRLAVFSLSRQPDHCFNTVARVLWTYLKFNSYWPLVADFQHYMTEIDGHKDLLEFVANGHFHQVKSNTVNLDRKIEFAADIILSDQTTNLRNLPRSFRSWLATDTNTDAENSRKEPIDVLSYRIASTRYRDAFSNTTIDEVGRIAMVVAAIKHMLLPELNRVPEFFLAKTVLAAHQDPQESSLLVFCTTPTLAVKDGLTGHTPNRDGIFSYLRIPRKTAVNLRTKPAILSCGRDARLFAEIESLNVPLESPKNHRFQVGEDKKVKGVITFPIVQSASGAFLNTVKLGTVLKGYKIVEDAKVTDLKAEFLKEMEDADFYFPAAHQTNEAKFLIGYVGATRLRLQSEHNGVIKELLAFVPGETTASNNAEQVDVTMDDLSNLFRSRRKLNGQRRLTVQNIACHSSRALPSWMRVYKQSLDSDISESEIRSLTWEVPIIVTSQASFATTTEELVKHGKYPFTSLELASNENTINDLIQYLQGQSFQPATNLESNEYLEVATPEKNFTIKVQDYDGRFPYVLTY